MRIIEKLFTSKQHGVAGYLGFTASGQVGEYGAGATLKLEINNTSQPVDVSGVFGVVLLDAGPFIQIVLSDLRIELPGIEIEGDFAFRQAILNGTPTKNLNPSSPRRSPRSVELPS